MMEKLIEGARQLALTLTPRQIRQFQTYYDELILWNQRVNLTAITGYEDVQVKHFVDSLTIATALDTTLWTEGGPVLLDVGTGAGMPGLPLKIAFPNARLVLLDSVSKKTAFLTHLVRKLELDEVEVVTGRAEDIGHLQKYRERFDLVVCRAVSQLPAVAELTLPFCKIGGLAVVQKKADVEAEICQAARAIDILGGRLKNVREIAIRALQQHVLVIIEKVSPTPPDYPRRPGVPTKRPLR